MKDIAEDPFTFWEHIWLFITNNILWIIIVLALIVAWIIYKRITRKDLVKDELFAVFAHIAGSIDGFDKVPHIFQYGTLDKLYISVARFSEDVNRVRRSGVEILHG